MPVKTVGQRRRPRSRGTALLQRAQVAAKQPLAQGLEERPEHMDLLLEDVMMGLDILPSNKTTSKPTPRTRRCVTPASVAKKRKQDGSTAVVVASGGRGMASSEGPVLQQQQNDGEITDMLDQFLQSFERLESVAAQDSTESEPHTNVNQRRKLNLLEDSVPSAGTPAQSMSTQSETSGTDSPKGLSQTSAQLHKNSSPAVRRTRRKKDFLFSLEKPRAKRKKVSVNSALKKEEVEHQTTKQLKQIPVVQLERRLLPKNRKVVSQSPSPRARNSTSANMSTKTYPIRSRFKESLNTEILSTPRGQMEHNKEVESTTRKGRKRALVSNNEESSSVEVKRIKLLNSPSQMTDTDVIDVETISLSSTHNPVLIDNLEGETDLILEVCSTNADQESNDIIDVDSLDEDLDQTRGLERELVQSEVVCSLRADIVTTCDALENDIDVTGGSSPAPTPVLISWTDSSEFEDDVGSESSEEMTVVLSKGRLVRC
uniref:Uncharacterized protein n=1 Tax=Knipowitschia caucasica TaxID=637954 RepID=A0AAV2MKG3_KNICA